MHAGLRIARRSGFFLGAGLAILLFALFSPLHEASEQSFAAHMVQHELFMAIAAPLLVLARPLPMVLWTLPRDLRLFIGRGLNAPALRHGWKVLTRPFDAWLLHALAIWIWHIPALFQATETSELVHAAQHISFFGSAVLFWWSIVHGRRHAQGVAMVSLFTTAVHTSVLGAMMTFARQPWYPIYESTVAQWGLTPLGDQQLGGLIMWVPASAAYLVAALLVMRRWLRHSEWTVAAAERAMVAAE